MALVTVCVFCLVLCVLLHASNHLLVNAGGANEAVLRMLEKIGTVENVGKFVEQVKAKKVKLMGFGHRVYKNYDPRARIVQQVANEVNRTPALTLIWLLWRTN